MSLPKKQSHELAQECDALKKQIDELKQAVETAQARNLQLQTLIDALPDVVYFKDTQGRNLIFNSAFEKLVGRPRTEIVGKTDEELLPPELAQHCRQSDRITIKTGKPVCFVEEEATGVDDRPIYFETTKIPLLDDGGNVTGLVGVSRSITERKLAEEVLKKAHEELERRVEERTIELSEEIIERKRVEKELEQRATQLMLLNEIGGQIAMVLELDRVLARAARLVQDSFGYHHVAIFTLDREHNKLVMRAKAGSFADLFPPDHQLQFGQGMVGWVAEHGQRLLANDVGAEPLHFNPFPEVIPTRSELTVPIKISEEVVGVLDAQSRQIDAFDENDVLVMETLADQIAVAVENARLYAAVQQELIERKRTEKALRESEDRYRFVSELTSDYAYAFRVEPDGKLIPAWATGALVRITGYTADELQARGGWESMIYPDDLSIPLNQLESLLAGEAKTVEYRILTKNGEVRWTRDYARPVWDEEQGRLAHIYGAIQDITERKQAETQIKLSLKEKEILLQEIHHRVKNNLQVISSLLNLQAGYLNDQQAFDLLQDSQNRVRSMALIHEKLYQSPDLARIDIAEYIRNLVTYLIRSYRVDTEKINLIIKADNISLGVDLAVPCGLILNELVSNSFKYAFPNGKIGKIYIELSANRDGQFTLTVGDNGVGLPPDINFQRTTSLGLQLVNTLVEQLDGTIKLDNTRGTEFEITFAML